MVIHFLPNLDKLEQELPEVGGDSLLALTLSSFEQELPEVGGDSLPDLIWSLSKNIHG